MSSSSAFTTSNTTPLDSVLDLLASDPVYIQSMVDSFIEGKIKLGSLHATVQSKVLGLLQEYVDTSSAENPAIPSLSQTLFGELSGLKKSANLSAITQLVKSSFRTSSEDQSAEFLTKFATEFATLGKNTAFKFVKTVNEYANQEQIDPRIAGMILTTTAKHFISIQSSIRNVAEEQQDEVLQSFKASLVKLIATVPDADNSLILIAGVLDDLQELGIDFKDTETYEKIKTIVYAVVTIGNVDAIVTAAGVLSRNGYESQVQNEIDVIDTLLGKTLQFKAEHTSPAQFLTLQNMCKYTYDFELQFDIASIVLAKVVADLSGVSGGLSATQVIANGTALLLNPSIQPVIRGITQSVIVGALTIGLVSKAPYQGDLPETLIASQVLIDELYQAFAKFFSGFDLSGEFAANALSLLAKVQALFPTGKVAALLDSYFMNNIADDAKYDAATAQFLQSVLADGYTPAPNAVGGFLVSCVKASVVTSAGVARKVGTILGSLLSFDKFNLTASSYARYKPCSALEDLSPATTLNDVVIHSLLQLIALPENVFSFDDLSQVLVVEKHGVLTPATSLALCPLSVDALAAAFGAVTGCAYPKRVAVLVQCLVDVGRVDDTDTLCKLITGGNAVFLTCKPENKDEFVTALKEYVAALSPVEQDSSASLQPVEALVGEPIERQLAVLSVAAGVLAKDAQLYSELLKEIAKLDVYLGALIGVVDLPVDRALPYLLLPCNEVSATTIETHIKVLSGVVQYSEVARTAVQQLLAGVEGAWNLRDELLGKLSGIAVRYATYLQSVSCQVKDRVAAVKLLNEFQTKPDIIACATRIQALTSGVQPVISESYSLQLGSDLVAVIGSADKSVLVWFYDSGRFDLKVTGKYLYQLAPVFDDCQTLLGFVDRDGTQVQIRIGDANAVSEGFVTLSQIVVSQLCTAYDQLTGSTNQYLGLQKGLDTDKAVFFKAALLKEIVECNLPVYGLLAFPHVSVRCFYEQHLAYRNYVAASGAAVANSADCAPLVLTVQDSGKWLSLYYTNAFGAPIVAAAVFAENKHSVQTAYYKKNVGWLKPDNVGSYLLWLNGLHLDVSAADRCVRSGATSVQPGAILLGSRVIHSILQQALQCRSEALPSVADLLFVLASVSDVLNTADVNKLFKLSEAVLAHREFVYDMKDHGFAFETASALDKLDLNVIGDLKSFDTLAVAGTQFKVVFNKLWSLTNTDQFVRVVQYFSTGQKRVVNELRYTYFRFNSSLVNVMDNKILTPQDEIQQVIQEFST